MKQRILKKTVAVATFSLVIMCASIAATSTIPESKLPDPSRFEITTPQSLVAGNDIAVELRFLSGEFIGKVLAEKTAFTEETRPLLRDLRNKWAALAKELADPATEASTTALLQQEIATLGTRLAKERLDHMLAIKEIQTNGANGQG